MAVTVYSAGMIFAMVLTRLLYTDAVIGIIALWGICFLAYMLCEFTVAILWIGTGALDILKNHIASFLIATLGLWNSFILMIIFVGLNLFPWQEIKAGIVFLLILFMIVSSIVVLLISSAPKERISACRIWRKCV